MRSKPVFLECSMQTDIICTAGHSYALEAEDLAVPLPVGPRNNSSVTPEQDQGNTTTFASTGLAAAAGYILRDCCIQIGKGGQQQQRLTQDQAVETHTSMTDAHDCCARGSAYRSDDSSDHCVLVRFFEKAEPDWGEEQSEISLKSA